MARITSAALLAISTTDSQVICSCIERFRDISILQMNIMKRILTFVFNRKTNKQTNEYRHINRQNLRVSNSSTGSPRQQTPEEVR